MAGDPRSSTDDHARPGAAARRAAPVAAALSAASLLVYGLLLLDLSRQAVGQRTIDNPRVPPAFFMSIMMVFAVAFAVRFAVSYLRRARTDAPDNPTARRMRGHRLTAYWAILVALLVLLTAPPSPWALPNLALALLWSVPATVIARADRRPR